MSDWKRICSVEEIPVLGSRVVKREGKDDIAVFRNSNDEVFAVVDKCPHKGGPLSQGIVSGRQVTCPLHAWNISLETGEAIAPDHGCTHKCEVKVENGEVFLHL